MTANKLENLFDALLEGEAFGEGFLVSAGEAAARLSEALDDAFPDAGFHERVADSAFDEALVTRTVAAPADLMEIAAAVLPPPGGGLVQRLSGFMRFASSAGGWQWAGGLAAASIALVVVVAPLGQSPSPDLSSPVDAPLDPSASAVFSPDLAAPDYMNRALEPGGWAYTGEAADFSNMHGGSADTFALHDETGCGAGSHETVADGGKMKAAEPSMKPSVSGGYDDDASPCDPAIRLSSPEEMPMPFVAAPAGSMPATPAPAMEP